MQASNSEIHVMPRGWLGLCEESFGMFCLGLFFLAFFQSKIETIETYQFEKVSYEMD